MWGQLLATSCNQLCGLDKLLVLQGETPVVGKQRIRLAVEEGG